MVFAETARFVFVFFCVFCLQFKLYKELKVYSKNTAAFSKNDVCAVYDRLTELSEKSAQIQQISSTLNIPGGILSGVATDCEQLSKALQKTVTVNNIACSDKFSDSEKQHIISGFVKRSPQEISECAKNLAVV